MSSRKPLAKPSALPQGPSRPSGSELKVYRPASGSIPIPIPNPSRLRKQQSLSNLSVLTDAEKKLHLYQSPGWNDDTSRTGTGTNKAGQTKTGQAGGGRAPLSRTLSKSEQSLFQGKTKPFCSLALTSNAGKPSRIPAPEEKKERKEIEGEDDKGFLKVDPELVVTVLGDLEQLLFSQVLDPESQRKRTVQNVLDLRQNLEETMTSLRGVQLSHSCVEGTMCYDSDEAAAFSISSLSNRSSPLSWRQGQASPRLQAGDAPSTGNTQSDVPLRISHTSRIHLIEALDDSDPSLLKADYLSDSDLGGKSPNEDDEDDDDIDDLGNGCRSTLSVQVPGWESVPHYVTHLFLSVSFSWDESSSISSGLSDGSDNLSSEEFNTSPTLNSLPTTPIGSRRSSTIVTWESTTILKLLISNFFILSSSCPGTGKSDGKPMDKSRLAVKTSGLQRSSSDAGKDHRNGSSGGEQRKPPSGLVRPSTGGGGNFGFKKPNTVANSGTNNVSTPTVMSTSGSAIPCGSATVGKIPKTSGIPVKPGAGGGGGGRKTSLDVSSSDQSGFLSPNARTSLQYRSLPRPAKTSTLTLTRPSSARFSSGTGLSKAGGRGIPSPSPVNQTDREKEKERAKAKAVVSDSECGGGSLKGSPAQTPAENGGKLQGLRPPSSGKGMDLTSPSTHRLSGVRSLAKPPSMAQLDKLNSNSLEVGVQDSLPPKIPPYSKLQDMAGSAGISTSPCLTPSPAPLLNVNSSACFSSSGIGLGPRQASSLCVEANGGSTSPLLYPRLSGMHRSMESLQLQMSLAPEPQEREKNRERESAVRTYANIESREKVRQEDRGSPATWGSGSKVSLTLTDSGPPRMTRSNSIPTHDASMELYGASPLGSTMSLAERPRSMGMVRSGSFRDKETDEVHGSVLSLASNASSSYSSQIRKLRRELESSQEKVSNLTTQLSANANLVAAFEQSLALMTTRLQGLSISHEQKDSELIELRETIEALKARNEEAQAVIQGALNNPDNMKDLRIRRQNSCESISSLNSLTSMSSVGSLKDQDAKKKKKKSWLRSSFNKAFSIKKGTKTYSDIEEIATPDSSAPNSPKMPHEGGEGGEIQPSSLKTSVSATSSVIMETTEEGESEETAVSDLRSELWDKERELTDIRLEALNSAHQLEQLREAMNNMQVCFTRMHEYTRLTTEHSSLSLARTDWTSLDCLIAKTFKVSCPLSTWSSLGLSSDSLHTYQLTQGEQRVIGGEKPQASPFHCLGSGSARIFVTLKGLREKCVDSLVFETLIPKPMMLHYISLLLKHRRLVLSGPSGTGKTFLAQRLAHYLLHRSRTDSSEADHEPCPPGRNAVVTFNMHHQSPKELQLYLSNLANQIDRHSGEEVPLVVIIDDISDSAATTELVNGALTCKHHKCPYIIGTTNQPVKMTSNNGLHLSFRMVMFSNNVEPANGFLLRYLHRKAVEAYQPEEQDSARHQALLCVLDWVPQLWYHLHTFLEKHSTSDFLIGPCFFLSCPVSVSEFRQWFIDLWNHSIIPYLQEGAKDGIKVNTIWEDPVDWVRGTLPWPNAQQDQSRLFHLPPPSIGPLSEEKKPPKDTPPPSTLESDPLMAMLLKLQESANYIESPEREGCLDSTLQATL
uniref:Neuron navigator 1 n=1 Tax=Anabas testudineus TaxID=64144 RepID=A0A7N6F8Q7_ANATE